MDLLGEGVGEIPITLHRNLFSMLEHSFHFFNSVGTFIPVVRNAATSLPRLRLQHRTVSSLIQTIREKEEEEENRLTVDFLSEKL